MPPDAHAAAHALVESIAGVVLIAAGLIVLGLMARRRRLGLTSSVVRSAASPARTLRSVAVVPLVGVAALAIFLAVVRVASA